MIRDIVPVRRRRLEIGIDTKTVCVLRSLSRCVEIMGRLMGIAAKLAVPGWS